MDINYLKKKNQTPNPKPKPTKLFVAYVCACHKHVTGLNIICHWLAMFWLRIPVSFKINLNFGAADSGLSWFKGEALVVFLHACSSSDEILTLMWHSCLTSNIEWNYNFVLWFCTQVISFLLTSDEIISTRSFCGRTISVCWCWTGHFSETLGKC